MDSLTSINPATDEVIRRYPLHTPEEVSSRLDRAVAARRGWAQRSLAERAAVLRATADVLRERREHLAATATAEMGKTLAEARAEVDKCAQAFTWFADHGPAHLADVPLDHGGDDTASYAAHRPLGTVLAIMPWNFPYWQVVRFAAPALLAGNAGVLKHADQVTGCALALEDALAAGGLPAGLFAALVMARADVAGVVADRRVAAVTLTGSTGAGRSVAAAAGTALKKTVLELGGSDYFIVLDDADPVAAARVAVLSRFQNAGQSCIAAKRFILTAGVADAFTEAFLAQVDALVVGDPTQDATTTGPMARRSLRDDLVDQVARGLAGGAEVLRRGGALPGRGAFYAPTVVRLATADNPLLAEETFGPVAPLITVADTAAAVALANASDYGLGGNLWTADLDRARTLAAELDSGQCFINGMTTSAPPLPFGGVKDSGYGRELSRAGLQEFTNLQTVVVAPPQGAAGS